jgi:hypothetical protein
MALDPEDPLIPLPWQMENIRAYRAQRGVEAEMDRMRSEKLRLDLEEARAKTLPGRVGEAEQLAMIEERTRQRREGTPIGGEVGRMATSAGGPSLLEATRMQQDLEVQRRAEQARLGAIEQYGIERGLTPTAKIDMGGMSATVPFTAGGERMADSYSQIYRSMVPRLAETYQAEGFSRDEAIRMASDQVRKELVKASSSGKVVLMGTGGGTISYSNEQAMKMWKDPSTPSALKAQLDEFFGPSETPKASNWVNTRLGR